ncbi:MAG: LptA/OstA family protein [Deltaproteobacteria bacterium]
MSRWLLLGVLFTLAAPAQRLADDRPVQMRSTGGLEIDLEKKVGRARGDVVIEREDVVVCCDEAEAKYSEQRIERVTCRGDVVIVRPDGTKARADVAVFVAERDAVTLFGKAKVYAPEAMLSGDRIVYDIGRDKLSVEGKGSRFSFEPKGKKAPSLRACPPEPRP